ncbi:MAG: hypothetical protein JST67_06145 [Bacteroidetes bacterium]|nr:hypothetical protein [Bacteroidota bacterium]
MKHLIYAPLILSFGLTFCSNDEANTKVEIKTKAAIKNEVKVEKNTEVKEEDKSLNNQDTNNLYNATASVLAGLKSGTGSLHSFLDSAAWKENAAAIDSSWKRLERHRLNKMRAWRSKELTSVNENPKTLFYPFSGPDFLTAYTFFPEVENYVMLGLEPVGKLPEIKKMKGAEAQEYVQYFKTSLSDIFNKSYFITQYMGRDLQNQKVNGTLPIISFFIRRTGNQISDVKYLAFDNKNNIVEVPYTYKSNEHKPFGVHISIVSQGKAKNVYYFRYDVSNKKFNDTTSFLKYLQKMQAPVATYIKSASYLLHNNFMSNMLGFILKQSEYVVQDDTGVPFKYFVEKNQWNYKVYGEYQKPVKNFNWLDRQPALQALFDKDSLNIPKLPFHLGYHWNTNKDVLIVCSKKK